MAVQTSYYLYKKYEKRGDQPWLPVLPETLSIDGNGSMPKVKKMDDDPNCPLYKWATSGTTCVGVNKYQNNIKVQSFDNGLTWSVTIPEQYSASTLIESQSTDCGYSATTVSSNTYCLDENICVDIYSVVSTDYGQTWSTAYTITSIVEPKGCKAKLKLTLNDSSKVAMECDATSALTRSEISAYSASVTSAIIGDCVTELSSTGYGDGVFQGCTGLTSVTIPVSVTTLGAFTFRDCTGITSINIPDSVTAISNNAFDTCTSLTGITIPSGVTVLNTSLFYGCTSLKSINIPNSVTTIGLFTFYGCRSLTSITIPNSVTSIASYAFEYCSSLTGVTIPNGVTIIDGFTFYGCSSLQSITIPNSVTSIAIQAFEHCSSLQSITIPSSVADIGVNAFYGCSGLTSITVNAVTPPTLGNAAFYNTNNCPIYVPCESVNAYKTAWSTYADRIQGMQSCTIYRWTQSGTTCLGFDKHQNNIKEQSSDNGLTWSVTIPEQYSASTLIESQSTDCGFVPFDGKFRLRLKNDNLIVGECDSTSAITSGEVSSRYSGTCLHIEVGDCVTSIGDYAFGYKPPATYRKLPILTGVTFSDTVTSFGIGVFSHCSGLTSVILPSNLTSIPRATFDYSSLVDVIIPNSVTIIDSDAFFVCRNLKRINSNIDGVFNIPSGVTEIGTYAFQGCSCLTSVVLPATITKIGTNSFARNSNLTSLTCLATTPPIGDTLMLSFSDNCLIYVPTESVEAYKSASGWSNYASRIQAIP